jgi:hypothetical protein
VGHRDEISTGLRQERPDLRQISAWHRGLLLLRNIPPQSNPSVILDVICPYVSSCKRRMSPVPGNDPE